MKQTCVHSAAVLAVSAACLLGTGSAKAYEDAYVTTSDETVRRTVSATGIAYVFTNAAAGSVSVSLKQGVTVTRALVVAGGGGGGGTIGGGGGGGGVIETNACVSLNDGATFTLAVGAGGAVGANGGDSTLTLGETTWTAIGGGHGGVWGDPDDGTAGGSGGGATMNGWGGKGTAGQGHDGGSFNSTAGSAGGGGAGESGKSYNATDGGVGGEGLASDITGSTEVYGSGGGGGGGNDRNTGGRGGTNAGTGGTAGMTLATAGVDGFGGGGGGGGLWGTKYIGAQGGAGTVIVVLGAPDQKILTVATGDSHAPESAYVTQPGSYEIADSLTVSATDWMDDTNLKRAGEILGYTLETYDAASNAWGAPVTNSATSYTYDAATGGRVRLTWLWRSFAYVDDFLMSTDPATTMSLTPYGRAYVFTEQTVQQTVALRQKSGRLMRQLLVGGGGGGGTPVGGGGGGGGVLYSEPRTTLAASTRLTFTIGAGGDGNQDGGATSLTLGETTTTAFGGGYGGRWGGGGDASQTGDHGSAGGASMGQKAGTYTSGQGNGGGSGMAGGGGGAGARGSDYSKTNGGKGGEGHASDITGTTQVYGSGGGGGANGDSATAPVPGVGGTNAGSGGKPNAVKATSGVDGFGGGGGGSSPYGGNYPAGKGGSGTVVLAFAVEGESILVVDAGDAYDVERPASAVTPTAGAYAQTDAIACRAEAWRTGDVTGEPTGYVVETLDPATGTWSETARGDGATYTAEAVAAGTIRRITWQWYVTRYSDELLETSDGAVRQIVTPTDTTYVFTNVATSAYTLKFKYPVTITEALLVGGGGGGGIDIGGGGGGGGVVSLTDALTADAGVVYNLTVGAGGINRVNGGATTFAIGDARWTVYGGGAGGRWQGAGNNNYGLAGGSGGGGAMGGPGGSGIDGQGHAGGRSVDDGGIGPGGGGGAGEAGKNYNKASGGVGGEGLAFDITGETQVYGSGGAGGGADGMTFGTPGTNAGAPGQDAPAGFGGGGGGGIMIGGTWVGGKGGSGTLILKLKPTGRGRVVIATAHPVPDSALTPGLGTSLVEDGATLSAATVEDPETRVKSVPVGYALEEQDATTGAWGLPVTNAATSLTYVLADHPAPIRLTWLWTQSLGEDCQWQDRFIETTDPLVRKLRVKGSSERSQYVYVFTNPGSHSIVLKTTGELRRALVVGGGGGGGGSIGGGGGGGGVVALDADQTFAVNDVIRLSVGAGGVPSVVGKWAEAQGGDSSLAFGSVATNAYGGGAGGFWRGDNKDFKGRSGASGGGTTMATTASEWSGGKGIAGQGHDGGNSNGGPGGGGGAGEAGKQFNKTDGGVGGEGLAIDITGESVVYGSGGGGGAGNGWDPKGRAGTNAGEPGEAAPDGFGGGGGGGIIKGGTWVGGKGGAGTVILSFDPTGVPLGTRVILR